MKYVFTWGVVISFLAMIAVFAAESYVAKTTVDKAASGPISKFHERYSR